ncbi:glutamyl-tRNA reductase [Arthrobacter sp. V4I6]|uniref:glutamyl-tRNA reductase n=1 Tax=unclassified Arthrobacter TaxID=235627 RepID=UPI002786C852|nr:MULTISPECIES: glutamyl-tRNA reductase [unclassified Arthrobacter]MDQ0820254.1 glutamyl-tRNA reductase [Arthrobacter sp. V1I7]MDQ0854436.1 glutamyl-tRNA reductase [Arthrobacter sp. V4I6]
MPETFLPVDPELRNSADCPALLVLVAKYRDLDIESAARLHAASAELAPHLLASSAAISGSVVLSTCNRFEIYCEVPSSAYADTARAEVLVTLSFCTGLPGSRLDSLFEHVQGPSATEHLFAVAAGLDSVVVGEREVAGQVRRSFADAQAAGTVSGRLGRLFQAASRTAKDVGAQTSLRSASRSIASVALDLAAGSGQPGPADVSVVLFGTGAYAACIAEILRGRQCSAISVFSQSGRADAFVAARGGTALSALQLPSAVARADLVIGCSGTGTRIDSASLLRWRADTARPLTIIDLAPSHDFDPRVAELPGIELITLESVQHAAPPADAEVLRLARALVRQAALRFEEQEASRVVDAAVVALRRHIHRVLDLEMERVSKQHGCGASADEVNFALRRLVRRLLYLPAVRARELATEGRQDEYAAALDALFGLTVQLGSPMRPVAVAGAAQPAQVPPGMQRA